MRTNAENKITIKEILLDLYTLKLAEKQYEKMLKVSHRHVVFTIPYELRNYFYSNRELINRLQDGVNEVIRYYYSKGN